MISSRLSGLSSGLEEFDDSKPIYQKALEEAGYSDMLKFTGNTTSQPKQNTKRKRKRNIIWYTPPFNKEVKSNITKMFIQTLEKCFPPGNPLRKIFNKNTVKISYSTTKNVTKIISAHNRKVLEPMRKQTKPYNCRGGIEVCPVEGKCQEAGVIYQADVETEEEGQKTYIGGAATTFKLRWSNHNKSFKNHDKSLKQCSTNLQKNCLDFSTPGQKSFKNSRQITQQS